MSGLKALLRPLALGLAALLAVGGGYLLYQNMNKDDYYVVTAYFEKAIGLFPNSDVDVLGVPIGKVHSVDPQGSRVKVVMHINNDYKVPADARAQIVPISVISDRYVQLFPAYTGQGPAMQDGAILDQDRTQIPAELDDVFKQLKKLLDAIKPGQEGEPGTLGSLIVELNQTLQDREDDLQGTLIQASELTGTLADAGDDISEVLINLDSLFGTLATKAGDYDRLNQNLLLVLTALAESRDDLQGALSNLASLTNEVGDLVADHQDTLDKDLEIALKVTSTILKNRASVEESLEWLPVVGEAAANAYHPNPVDAVDVRDNAEQRLECEILDVLPPSPIKDILKELCEAETGEPGENSQGGQVAPPTAGEQPEDEGLLELNCDRGVRKVRKQIRKVEEIGLSQEASQSIVEPLKEQLKDLKKKCKKIGETIDGSDDGDGGLLDDLQDIDDLLDDPPLPGVPDGPDLTGNAAGTTVAAEPGPGVLERVGGWMNGLLGFMGWGS